MNAGTFGGHARVVEDGPRWFAVDRVVCFGEVNEGHVQRGFLLRQPVKTPCGEHPFLGKARRAEATIFLDEDVLALTLVTQAGGDDLDQDFAGVCYEGDASVVAGLRRGDLLE